MTKAEKPPSDQLRRAIDGSGQSRYAICKATGIDQATLSRFMTGSVGLSLPSLDALGKYLGLRLTASKPRKRKR